MPCACACLCVQGAEADLLRISNKVRFILAVVNGELVLAKRRKADIEGELEDEGYDKLAGQKKAQAQVRTHASTGGRWRRGLPRGGCSGVGRGGAALHVHRREQPCPCRSNCVACAKCELLD